ncbi:Polycomb group RING finger protein 6 [Linum perenne]
MELFFGADLSQRTIDLNLPPPENHEPDTHLRTTTHHHHHHHHHHHQLPLSPSIIVNAAGANVGISFAPSRRVVESNDDDDDVEVNGAEAGQRLRCSICKGGRVRDPTATRCGHVFCRICIQTALIWKKKCPTCNASLRGERSTFRIYLN